MIATLRRALARLPEPRQVKVNTWRHDANNGKVTLGAHERITVTHPKARFAAINPYTPYTQWVNPGRSGAGLVWLLSVAGLALYGRKWGRGPLKDLNGFAPFSADDEAR